MTTLARPGVPVGGFKTVGQIHATNDLVFQRNQNAMGVAVELLSTHTPGAPVVDERGEFIGFVSEFDILRVLEAKKDLNQFDGRGCHGQGPYRSHGRHQHRRGREGHGRETTPQPAGQEKRQGGLFRHAARSAAGLDRPWSRHRNQYCPVRCVCARRSDAVLLARPALGTTCVAGTTLCNSRSTGCGKTIWTRENFYGLHFWDKRTITYRRPKKFVQQGRSE